MIYLKVLVYLFYFHILVEVTCDQVYVNSNKNLFDLDLYENVLDPELCSQQLDYLQNDTLLSMRFLSAGLRLPRGILQGNFADLGDYHACLGIKEETTDTVVEGKYCLLNVPTNQSLPFSKMITETNEIFLNNEREVFNIRQSEKVRTGLRLLSGNMNSMNVLQRTDVVGALPVESLQLAICVPRACTTKEATDSLLPLSIEFEEAYCRLPDDKQIVPAYYVFWTIFFIFGLLTLLSTGYDVHQTVILEKDQKTTSALYRSFSLYTNTRRLLTFNNNSGSLHCIDGIRSLAMIWMIMGHTFTVRSTILPLYNPLDMLSWIQSPRALWMTSGPITVDTFFLLSGLLLVYSTAGKFSSMKLLKNLHLFYLNRYLRLFPIMGLAVLLEASIMGRLTDGPYYEPVATNTYNCRKNWWRALLYIQNITNSKEMCLGLTWYLDVDMQMYILSPLILFWVLKGKIYAFISLAAGLIAIMVSSTVYNFINNFQGGPIVLSRTDEEADFYMHNHYVFTLTRGSPFVVGMIVGYIMYLCRGTKVVLNKFVVVLLWISSLILLSLIIYYNYPLRQTDYDNQTLDNFMNSFMRPAWALAIGWIVFACVYGYGGPINWLLSLNIWKLPARISLGLYLLHYSVLHIVVCSEWQPFFFSVSDNMYFFFADLSIAFLVAFLATLLVDAPFSTLTKLALSGGTKRPRKIEDKQNLDTEMNKKSELPRYPHDESDKTTL